MIDEKKLVEGLQKFINDSGSSNSPATLIFKKGLLCAIEIVNQQPKVGDWIPCEDGKNMPPEHESIFAKLKGADRWAIGMFEKSSDMVNAIVELEDGKRITKTLHTIDGEWDKFSRLVKFKVIAWKPLPEPYYE